MPRLYVVPFTNIVAIASGQDFWNILPAVNKQVRLKRVVLSSSDTTIPTSQMVRVVAGITTATATLGTGTVAGIAKTDPGDPAFSGTYTTNTTIVGTGTRSILYNNAFHIYNGLDENFDTDGRTLAQMVASNSTAVEGIYFGMLSTVSGTVHFDGTAWFEEFGG